MVTQPRFIQYIFSNVNNLREQRTFHNATTGFLVPLTAVFLNCNPFPWYFSFQLLCCTSFPPLPFIATFSILIILWLLHKFSNICTPEEGWYGQPKYCYKKTIHVVMNQLCSSLWTSHLWFIFFFNVTQHCVTSKKGLRGRLLVSLRNGWSKFTDLDIGVSLISMEILCSFLRRPIRGENSGDGELNVGYFLTLKCRPLYLIMPFFLLWLSYCKFFSYCILITLVEY